MEAIFEIPYSLARETSEEIEIYFAGMVWMGGWGGGVRGVGERGPFLKMMNVRDPGLVLAFKFYFSRRIDKGSAKNENWSGTSKYFKGTDRPELDRP